LNYEKIKSKYIKNKNEKSPRYSNYEYISYSKKLVDPFLGEKRYSVNGPKTHLNTSRNEYKKEIKELSKKVRKSFTEAKEVALTQPKPSQSLSKLAPKQLSPPLHTLSLLERNRSQKEAFTSPNLLENKLLKIQSTFAQFIKENERIQNSFSSPDLPTRLEEGTSKKSQMAVGMGILHSVIKIRQRGDLREAIRKLHDK
jgi:oligoendopeptidase F